MSCQLGLLPGQQGGQADLRLDRRPAVASRHARDQLQPGQMLKGELDGHLAERHELGELLRAHVGILHDILVDRFRGRVELEPLSPIG